MSSPQRSPAFAPVLNRGRSRLHLHCSGPSTQPGVLDEPPPPARSSWLNMVEIEIGVLRGQCLDRRIATWSNSYPRSRLGNSSAMPQVPVSNGCSQPQKLAPK
jgi:hypothetical protein